MSYRRIDALRVGEGPLESESDLRTVDWWGVVFLIVVLSAFYSAIMFSWFYLRSGAETWPPEGTSQPEVVLPSIATAALVLSCLPLIVLQLGLRSGSRPRFNLLLALGFLLGIAFTAVQVASFQFLDFGVRDHAYGSAFYTIEAYVIVLVLGGLYVGAIVQAPAWKGHFNAPRHVAITNLALYWYAVTAMWLITYVSIYLLPFFD